MRRMFILCLFLAVNIAWAAEPMPSVIRLSSSSDVSVAPDTARLRLAVTTQAEQAGQALKENAARTQSLLAALKKALGDNGKVQTGSYELSPVYEFNSELKKSVLTGYQVNNQLQVETRNLSDIGSLIDQAVKAGSNQIQSLEFAHSQADTFAADAMAQAIKKGQAQAQRMAAAAGVTLGPILEISTFSNVGPGPFYKEARLAMSDAAAPTPIEPGQMTISQSVNMVFQIQ